MQTPSNPGPPLRTTTTTAAARSDDPDRPQSVNSDDHAFVRQRDFRDLDQMVQCHAPALDEAMSSCDFLDEASTCIAMAVYFVPLRSTNPAAAAPAA